MKNNFNFREAYERMSAIKGRLAEMAENLESDKMRDAFSEAEEAERKQLYRELDILDCKVKANTPTIEVSRNSDAREVNRIMRESIKNGQRFEIKVRREDVGGGDSFAGTTSGYAAPLTADDTLPSPVTVHDIVEPLYNKTILAAIGAPLLTGLKGNHVWPVLEAFQASINGEGVALGDTSIGLTKLVAKPERIGIACPITREALNETDDLLQVVATKYMPEAIAATMNKIMFSPSKVSGSTALVGPFLTANVDEDNAKTYSTTVPTMADITALKGAILGQNVMGEGLCYVMNDAMAALLEATPKWEGSATAIIDANNTINGVPVFTTNEVGEGTIYCGAFHYAPCGLFGDMTLVVDPYTLSRQNCIDFVLNVDFAITVLRQEAFGTLTYDDGQ